MIRRFALLLVPLLLALPAFSQSLAKTFTLTAANQSACIGSNSLPTIGIDISGSASLTLQPSVSINGSTPKNSSVTSTVAGSTAQATIVTSGSTSASYIAPVGGFDTFCLTVSSFSSGTLTVQLNPSPALNASLLGGGGDSFPITPSVVNGSVINQVTATNNWDALGGVGLYAPQPALTGANSGGSLVNGNAVFVEITLNQGATYSLPSVEAKISLAPGTGCSSSACTVTVTAPTLTGSQTYSVYSSTSVGGGSGGELLNSACANITGNCVITAAGAGAALPTVNTSGVEPPSALASECPSNQDPFSWQQSVDGNWHSLAAIDRTLGLAAYSSYGFVSYCRPLIINTEQFTTVTPAPGVLHGDLNIVHYYTNTNPLANEFALQMTAQTKSTDANTYTNQLQGIYVENDILGSPVLEGGEANIGAIRGTTSIQGNPTMGGAQLGQAVGLSGYTERTGGAQPRCGSVFCFVGTQGLSINQGGADTGNNGWRFVGVMGQAYDSGSQEATGEGYGFFAPTPPAKFPRTDTWSNVGYYAQNFGNCAGCFAFVADGDVTDRTTGSSYFTGQIFVPVIRTTGTTVNVIAALNLSSSINTAQLPTATQPAISNHGTAGSTSYTYALVARDGNGDAAPASTTTTTSTGNATLDGTNYNRVCTAGGSTWVNTGVSGFDVYRTASSGTPSTTGKIGSVTTLGLNAPIAFTVGGNITYCLNDTGLAGDSTSAPGVNQTGAAKSYKLETLSTCVAAGTAASPSVVSCSGASAGNIYCDVAASAATCTVNTSAVTATSTITITPNAADGTELSKTCNPSPSVVPFAILASKSPGVSFTINMPTLVTNGACFEYVITN